LTGEALHRAIVLDRRNEVEKILDSPDGPRIIEIPDKFGNLPLMIAVNRNNLELVCVFSKSQITKAILTILLQFKNSRVTYCQGRKCKCAERKRKDSVDASCFCW
jgi:ankyrin repeat protein